MHGSLGWIRFCFVPSGFTGQCQPLDRSSKSAVSHSAGLHLAQRVLGATAQAGVGRAVNQAGDAGVAESAVFAGIGEKVFAVGLRFCGALGKLFRPARRTSYTISEHPQLDEEPSADAYADSIILRIGCVHTTVHTHYRFDRGLPNHVLSCARAELTQVTKA